MLLTDTHHRSDEDVEQFCAFAGQGVFDVYRRPARSGSRPRALFVDGIQLLLQPRFMDWLHGRLLQSVKAATRVVVFQDDAPSKALAQEVKRYCAESLGLPQIDLVSSSKLAEKKLSERTETELKSEENTISDIKDELIMISSKLEAIAKQANNNQKNIS